MNEASRASRGRSAGTPPQIGYLYPSGWGNLGDEAIQQSMIAGIRACWPNARIRGFTLNPVGTTQFHGIEAEAITGLSLRNNGIRISDVPAFFALADRVVTRITRPWFLHQLLRKAEVVTRTAALEVRSMWRAWRWLRHADALVVAGGGQLDALWGGAWGHPYALARWAWLAKRAGVPFVILSVGFGEARTRLSRAFLRYAVQSAAYCSLRDEGSRTLTAGLGVRTRLERVPDLAFGLHAAAIASALTPGTKSSLTIGVSPMAFRGGAWPDPDLRRYDSFVDLWASIVESRVARGDRVHLFTTQPGDEIAVDDVLKRLSDAARYACVRERLTTVEELIELYGRLDLVVATRLHGVLLALVAERPAVALSYERKVRALMTDAGLADFCVDLETTGLSEVNAAIDSLSVQREAVRAAIAGHVTEWGRDVARQSLELKTLVRASRT